MTAHATMLPPAQAQKQTLYEIAERIIAVLEESGGEVTDALDSLEYALEEKVAAYRIVILRLEAEAAMNKQLADEFAARRAAKERRAAALEERLLATMKALGRTNIKTAICTAYITKPKKVEVTADFCKTADERFVKETKEPKLKVIRAAIEAKEHVPNAELKESETLCFR